MQPAAVLSRKDIARLQKAIDRLVKIGESLNGQVAEIAPPKRRVKRTPKPKAAEPSAA